MLALLASVLFIFGPSCGGKSTLSKALVQELDSCWVYLDRDQLIEEGFCTEEKADETLEECIAVLHSNHQNIIVDPQIPWGAPQKDEVYILVYAPLPTLLARDDTRAARLHRKAQRNHYARLYVEKTFSEVFKAPLRLDFYYYRIFDSSLHSVECEIKEVLESILQLKGLYAKSKT